MPPGSYPCPRGAFRATRYRGRHFLKERARPSDAMYVQLPRSTLRHPGALTIALTLLAATDLAYRLLVREPVRRALGIVR